jgi:CheY-like chemotaxis protein
MKILIIDDSKVNLIMVSKMLEQLGNTVYRANDGNQAYEIISKNPQIDLIFLDWCMPVMSGSDFLTKNLEESLFTIPVIIMTTDQESLVINQAKKIGAIDYISKPFTTLRLEEKLIELFDYTA